MRTWVAMYAIVWLAFFEILMVLFRVFDFVTSIALHGALGVAILVLAFYVARALRKTACPPRIKRISVTTFALAIFQGFLGVALFLGIQYSWGVIYADVMAFLHVTTSIAIITQASSSATAFDMWEEKEFQTSPA